MSTVGAGGDGPVLAIVGPTASGKSSAAMEVAGRGLNRDRFGSATVDIVAADAFTVYRGMDIGTAKPSTADREAVRHHLVDVLEPWQETHAAWFQTAAREAIADVHERGAVPLLVGGSGLYFRAVVDPLRFPPTDPEVRREIADRYRDHPEEAHARLAEVDPDAAAKIEPANLRRAVRALEVVTLTGERFSSYDDSWEDYTSVFGGLDVRGLQLPRPALRSRIRERAGDMVEAGLVDEARRLREHGRGLSRTARQAIGYREAFAVLDGELDVADLVDEIATRTWRYAKRQLSWFDRDPRIQWHARAAIVDAWT